MTNGSSPRQGWSQAHIDIGALAQRVTGLENAIGNVVDQLRDIGKRLEARPTDIWKIVGGIVGVLALVGAFLYQGKAYIDADLDRHEREISRILETAVSRDDFRMSLDQQQRRNLAMDAATAKVADEVESARVEQARAEGMAEERHATFLREHAAILARVDTIDANLIKRPEIEAALTSLRELTTLTNSATANRIDAVIGSLNELRHDVGASYTWGDGLKHALDRIDNMQQELNSLAQTLGRAASAPTPAAPAR